MKQTLNIYQLLPRADFDYSGIIKIHKRGIMSEKPQNHGQSEPLTLEELYAQGRARAAEIGRERSQQLQQGQQQAQSWMGDVIRAAPPKEPSTKMPVMVSLRRATDSAPEDAKDQRPIIRLKFADNTTPLTPERENIQLHNPDSLAYTTQIRPPKPFAFDVKLKEDAKASTERGEKVAAAVNEKLAAVLGSALEERAVKSGVDLKREWGFDLKNDLVVRDGEPRMVSIQLKRYRSIEDHRELELLEKQMKDSALEQMVAIGLRPSEAELKIEEIAREASAAINIHYPTKWHEKGFENHVEGRLGDQHNGDIIIQQKVSIEISEKELAQRLGVGTRLTYAKGDALAAVNKELFGDDGIPRGSR